MPEQKDITYPVAVSDDLATGEIIFAGETGAVLVPSGTTAQRPADPLEGMFRYNVDTHKFEGYTDEGWGAIAGDDAAGGPRIISTGDEIDVEDGDTYIAWNSDTHNAKTVNIGTPGGPQSVVIKDAIGEAGTDNITIVGDGVTIDGETEFVMDSDYQAITLTWDGVSNWMVN